MKLVNFNPISLKCHDNRESVNLNKREKKTGQIRGNWLKRKKGKSNFFGL